MATASEAYEDPAEREKREDNALLESVSARLEEHFDTVRIIVTKSSGNSTRLHTRGGGNWYGQVGSVRDWIVEQDETIREVVRDDRR